MKDSIETIIPEIRNFMEANHLVEFPQALDLDSESILLVEWDNDDWRAFLQLAPAVGSNVVYVGLSEFSADSDEVPEDEREGEQSERKRGPIIRDLRFDEDDDVAVVRLFGREHRGETSSLNLAYVAGGVVHSWTTFAPWYEDALSTLVELRERFDFIGETVRHEQEEFQDREIREDWAGVVARDRRFFTAQAVPSVRQRITLEILTEITGIPPSEPFLVGASWSTSASARRLLPQVKRELEEEAIGHLPELTSELIRLHPEWATLRVTLREKYARAYLIEKIGMSLPTVTEEVARRKE